MARGPGPVGAEVRLDSAPVLHGAVGCSAAGLSPALHDARGCCDVALCNSARDPTAGRGRLLLPQRPRCVRSTALEARSVRAGPGHCVASQLAPLRK